MGTPRPIPGAPFVFQSTRDGDSEIIEARTDGTLRRLTDNAVADTDPAPTSDGRIAFASARQGGTQIYVIGPNSTIRVTNNGSQNSQPAWSPNGQQIAFRSTRSGNSDIYIVDADGKNEKRLTQSPSIESAPTFGPDGRIYFVSDGLNGLNGEEEIQIFSMRSDGTQVQQVTSGDAMPARPAVSPDGRLLAFVSENDDGAHIYTVALSQGKAVGVPRQLTREGTANLDASFSRDSRFVLFASNRSGNFDIYRTSLDGSIVQALITDPATDRAPRAR